jgi:hypothetical protein
MLKFTSRLLVVLAISGWAGSISAALIDAVDVEGTKWLQPIDFHGYSWNDVSEVCDSSTGVCSGLLGPTDLTGWTWASLDEVNSLLNNFIVTEPKLVLGTDFVYCDMCVDAYFAAGFNYETVFVPSTGWLRVSGGVSRTTSLADIERAYGRAVGQSAFVGILGSNTTILKDGSCDIGATCSGDSGAWFYSEVPTPETTPLIAIGLAGLGAMWRKKT